MIDGKTALRFVKKNYNFQALKLLNSENNGILNAKLLLMVVLGILMMMVLAIANHEIFEVSHMEALYYYLTSYV